MKNLTLVLIAIVALSTSAFAQSLSDAQCSVVRAIDAKFPALNKGTDDQRREFALKVAQQFTFSFPGEGWGSKAAGPGRPQTKDVVARNRNGALDGWELVDGASRSVKCNDHLDLAGQLFIPVSPVDYLGSTPPPPPPPPPTGEIEARLKAIEDVEREQLATSNAILELLQKAASRLGIK